MSDRKQVIILTAAFLCVAIILAIGAWQLSIDAAKIDTKLFFVTIAVMLCGGSLGLIVGMLASPVNATEKAHLTDIAATASALVSGYLASTAEGFLQRVLSVDHLFGDSINGYRVAAFICTFVLAAYVSFAWRKYFPPPRD